MNDVWKAVEALFAFQLGLFRGQGYPAMDVVEDFYGYAQVLTTDLQERIKEVVATRGEIRRLNDDGTADLLLRRPSTSPSGSSSDGGGGDKHAVPCDLVVCATGFQKD